MLIETRKQTSNPVMRDASFQLSTMAAQEREPQREQIARARVHDAQQAAGVMPRMKAQRQRQRVLEERDDRALAAPVRQPIGVEGDPYVERDPEEPEACPQADVAPRLMRRAHESADHTAKEPRLVKDEYR
jgi:hypothetical protein